MMPHLRLLCLFSVAAVWAEAARAQESDAVTDWLMAVSAEAPVWVWLALAGGVAAIAFGGALFPRRRSHRARTRAIAAASRQPLVAPAARARFDPAEYEDAGLEERAPMMLSTRADDPRSGGPRSGSRVGPLQGRGPGGASDAGDRSGAVEEERLLDFFAERFSIRERSSDAAIAYLERLAEAIDGLRRRAEEAENRAAALDDALRRAPAGGETGGDPTAAAWRVALDGARSIRIAAQALRNDPDFKAFSALLGFEDAVRRLISEQARLANGPLEARAVEEDWPHAIWRAEALLSAYFPTSGDWGDLRHGVSVAAAALRQLLLLEGVAVGHVRLLGPYEPGDGEIWSSSVEGLWEVGPIRERARQLAAASGLVQGQAQPLVIDCEAFGFSDELRGLSAQARLITLDPAAWT